LNLHLFDFDKCYYGKNTSFIAGIDEAGRGPLAGPVVASAVILPSDIIIDGLHDSKRISKKKREHLFEFITKRSLFYSIEAVDNKTIDNINILQATFLAMSKCVLNLKKKADIYLIDGNFKIPSLEIKQEAIVRGDAKSASIAAASILAKVTRDEIMSNYGQKYPQYGFEKHKGYGTKRHCEALLKFGPCPIHRKTFAFVNEVMKVE
jgi:ribonuclease HII